MSCPVGERVIGPQALEEEKGFGYVGINIFITQALHQFEKRKILNFI